MGLSGLYGDWATNSSPGRAGGEVQADAWPRITPAKCRIFFIAFWLVYWVDGNFLVGLLECRELFGWSIRLSGTFWLGYWVVGNFLVSLLGCRKLFGWATGS